MLICNQVSSAYHLHRSTKCFSLKYLLFAVLLISISTRSCLATDSEMEIKSTLCKKSEPLGMESGEITDKQINASSSYDTRSVGAQFSRLNRDESGGAWCPSQQLSFANSGTEYIEVYFNDRKVINGVATQGRFGNSVGVEFAEEFYIEYSRDNGLTWTRWKNRKGNHLLKGNQDTNTIKDNWLDLPIVGVNAIRLLPFSQYVRMVCLRFELYGCTYKDLPIQYNCPDGEFGGKYGDLVDDTYDGLRHKNLYLTKGLGQLTDGIIGLDDYKVNSGYEWIGWKATLNNSIEIVFEFEQLVNFTSVILNCHNLFHANIEYFQQLVAYFSLDGEQWSRNPIVVHLVPDHVNQNARDITVGLKNRIAKHVKLVLKFAAKWLLISEITFQTEPVATDYQARLDDLESQLDISRINKKSNIIQSQLPVHNTNNIHKNMFAQEKDDLIIKKMNFNNELSKKELNNQINQINQFNKQLPNLPKLVSPNMISTGDSITLNAILISSVIFICFCIFLLVSVIFYRKFNKKNDLLANNILKTTLVQNNNKLELIHKLHNVEFGIGDLNAKQSLLNLRQPSSLSSHTNTLQNKDNLNLLGINSPVTGSSSLINNNSNPNNSSNDSSLIRSESNHEYAVPNLSHYEEINQSNYSSIYNRINELEFNGRDQKDNHLKQTKLYTNKLNNFLNYPNGSNSSLSNLTSSLKRNQQINKFKTNFNNSKSTTMKINGSNGFSNQGLNNFQTQFSNRSFSSHKNQLINIKSILFNDLKLNQIQPNQKLIHSLIGQSKFGNLSLIKIKLDNNDKDKQTKQLALVETVDLQEMSYEYQLEYKQHILNWLNLIQQLKAKSFYEDAKLCLSNNFSSILGIMKTEPASSNRINLVMEYGNCSLAAFLKQHSPETLNTKSLLNLASQLSNVMYYLECNNVPYVTLGLRNLGFNKFTFQLKLIMPEILLDESISQSLTAIKNQFDSMKKNEKLDKTVFSLNHQLRWLAPENLTNGKFDCKGDVFSFANTIWQIFNYAKLRPYPQLSNEQILELFVQSFADLSCFKNSTKNYVEFKPLNNDNNEISIVQIKPDNMSDDIYDLLVDCWKLNPEQRISFSQCKLFFNNKSNSIYDDNYYH